MLGINSIDMHSFLTKLFFGLCVCLSLSSCHYYKVGKSIPGAYGLKKEIVARKEILVHSASDVFLLTNPQLIDSNKTLTGTALPPGPYHQFYKKTKKKGNPFKISQGNPTNEVHIYASEYTIIDTTKQMWVQAKDVKSMEVYANDNGLSNWIYIGLGLVVLAAGFFTLVLIILLSF
jgi:hypothetical protein